MTYPPRRLDDVAPHPKQEKPVYSISELSLLLGTYTEPFTIFVKLDLNVRRMPYCSEVRKMQPILFCREKSKVFSVTSDLRIPRAVFLIFLANEAPFNRAIHELN